MYVVRVSVKNIKTGNALLTPFFMIEIANHRYYDSWHEIIIS